MQSVGLLREESVECDANISSIGSCASTLEVKNKSLCNTLQLLSSSCQKIRGSSSSGSRNATVRCSCFLWNCSSQALLFSA